MRGSSPQADAFPGQRRRAGSCPPEGRLASGPALGTSRSTSWRGGLLSHPMGGIGIGQLGALGGIGIPLRPGDFGSTFNFTSGAANIITARIIATDRGGIDLSSSRPPTVPGTLQLTVLVPVLLGPPPRTEEDVAGIGTSWTNGGMEDLPGVELLSKLSLEDQGEAALDSCGICLQPFQEGEKLTALPCAVGVCPSVWHDGCVRKWLCQGHSPTCPLCRATMGGATPSSSNLPQASYALEVRAALPLSATSALAAAGGLGGTVGFGTALGARGSADAFRNQTRATFNANANTPGGLGAANALLQQLGQEIIQDILMLTLPNGGHAGGLAGALGGHNLFGFGGGGATLTTIAGTGSTTATILADLGGLVLRTLSPDGTSTTNFGHANLPARGSGADPSRPNTNNRNANNSNNNVAGAPRRSRRNRNGGGANAATQTTASVAVAAGPVAPVGSAREWLGPNTGPAEKGKGRGNRGQRQKPELQQIPEQRGNAGSSSTQEPSSSSFAPQAVSRGGRGGGHWVPRHSPPARPDAISQSATPEGGAVLDSNAASAAVSGASRNNACRGSRNSARSGYAGSSSGPWVAPGRQDEQWQQNQATGWDQWNAGYWGAQGSSWGMWQNRPRRG
mmetsp:Transcript_67766/g.122131  ORF Transcript_67766/g.122131 Transcript_67766/m.122131 type:complete len:623 (-) Transcript_67766:117-1985(-)